MTLTLWRGEHLIGELRPRSSHGNALAQRPGKPPSFSALLVRTPDAPPIKGVWQIAPPIPGIGVQQHALEPDIVSQRYQRATRAPSGSGALHPVSPEEAAGVPVEEQFTVHDARGRVYLPLQIALQESRFETQQYADVLREAPAEAIVDGIVWTAFVVFASENDAPAT